MTRDELQSTLQQPYQRDRWGEALRIVLPGTELFTAAQPVATANTQARQVYQLGRIRLAGGRNLAALEIVLDPAVDLVRNRVGLRNLVARFIDQAEYHGVLAVFLTENPAYRFTFAASESVFDDAGNVTRIETAPRRYTYILGPGEACRTPAERFAQLAAKGAGAGLSDVIDAFSVDKLNKEFFADFCRAFQQVTSEIHRHHGAWPDALVEREAQTLLERLLFLYFVQRKGWLNRQRDYLAGHFRQHYTTSPKGTTYLDHFLRPLFVKLSTEGPHADIPGHDLPFLNGGLFNDEYGDEQNDATARRHKEMIVSNETFHFVFENLLERYNFTIHEDSPTNQEVAIDPEMLGKIFESLVLQIEHSGTDGKSLRHDTGSHYTPRPVVQYLCRQAISSWLEAQPPFAGRPASLQPIAELLSLDASDGIDDAESKILTECLTPEEAAQLFDLLFELRACDPAVGSGAFAMGLLRELLNLARLCETRARGRDPVEGDRSWLYESKKRLIERVIYGVDIQERAVEICKLRLWLSLMVDHDLGVAPADCDARSFRRALKALEPLPNLDFKIRRANSLVDHIHGEPVQLSRLASETGAAMPLSKLASAKREFFNAHTAAAKRKLRLDIHEAITDIAKIELTRARTDAAGFGLALDEKATRRVAQLDHGLKEIASITAQVRDARKLRAAQQDEALERIRAHFEDPQKPTFVWQLDFAEVFHRDPPQPAASRGHGQESGQLALNSQPSTISRPGGFDITVTNPPYVRQELLAQYKDYFQTHYQAFDGTADLYVYFMEGAVRLLRDGGILSIVVSSSFLRATYGEGLRRFLRAHSAVLRIVDFGGLAVFQNAKDTYVCLPLIAKRPQPPRVEVCKVPSLAIRDLSSYIADHRFTIPHERLAHDAWSLKSDAEAAVFEKIMRAGQPLGDFVQRKFFRGVTTGLNEAFVINTATRTRLIASQKRSEELIKPLLNGEDIRRWSFSQKDQWLIFTRRGVNIDEFPAIKEHLAQWREDLTPKNTKQAKRGRKPGQYKWFEIQDDVAYYDIFDRPKLIYPDIAKGPRFCLDSNGHYLSNTAYCLGSKDLYLLAILNSRLFWFAIGNISIPFGVRAGEYRYRLIYQYMERVPIRPIDLGVASERAEHDALVTLVERILAAKRKDASADATGLEREIDQRVYRLYGLRQDEVKIVEGLPQ